MKFAALAFAMIAALAALFHSAPPPAMACIIVRPSANDRVSSDLVHFDTLAIATVLKADSWHEPAPPIPLKEFHTRPLPYAKDHVRLELSIVEEFKGNGAHYILATGSWPAYDPSCPSSPPPLAVGDSIFVALEHNDDGTVTIGGPQLFYAPSRHAPRVDDPDRAYLGALRWEALPHAPDGRGYFGYPRGEPANAKWIAVYFIGSAAVLYGLSAAGMRRASAARLRAEEERKRSDWMRWAPPR